MLYIHACVRARSPSLSLTHTHFKIKAKYVFIHVYTKIMQFLYWMIYDKISLPIFSMHIYFTTQK
jgi:hypothetical protein